MGTVAAGYGAGVYSEPRDLDRAALAGALARHRGIRVGHLDYISIGFGSHHWEAAGLPTTSSCCSIGRFHVAELRRPHEETEDTRASWENLGEHLP